MSKKSTSSHSDAVKVVVVVTTLLMPTIFFRGVQDSFDLTKATLLWCCGVVLILHLCMTTRLVFFRSAKFLPAASFLIAFAITSATSIRPWSSIFGQYQRYSGLLTYLSAFCVYLTVVRDFDVRWRARLITALRAAAAVCALYVIIQSLGWDPWSWSSPGQNRPLFGTMGNINTSAGLLGALSPLFLIGVVEGKTRFERSALTFLFLWVGIAIGLNQSFQGNVASLVSVGVLIVASVRSSSIGRLVLFLTLAATFFTWGLWADSTSKVGVALGVSLLLSAIAGVLPSDSVERKAWIHRSGARMRVAAVGAVVSIVVLVLLVGDRVAKELRGGMAERAAFYRSALGLWKDRPIFGYGPETFGYLYSIHRPQWHALNYEANRPSSAHSVPLGLLASGGLVLFLAFVVFVTYVLGRSYKGLRQGGEGFSTARICVGSAFLASLIQSLVSVEHVALITVFFVLAGLTVAGSYGDEKSGIQSRPSKSKVGGIAFAGLAVISLAIAVPQVSRPFRADLAVRYGLEAAYYRNDLQSAIAEIRRAVSIAPWDPQQQLRLVSMLQESGDTAASAREAARLSEMYNCLPSVSLGAAYAQATIGDLSKAQEIGRCAVEHDPYSIVVRQSLSELYAQMAEASFSNQGIDVASELVADSLELDPDNARAAALQISLSALTR